ncbi:response regulator [Pseudomonas typographi]|uniref:Response regulator n=1 Tax=Pseudomonas typographi TaxID=2715964 RepID=A0ABR7ZAR5_9PSED|nr:response regulator [Pseudomonas typographi]MBD1602452.1 response regulator [Pseudomonas typographi]
MLSRQIIAIAEDDPLLRRVLADFVEEFGGAPQAFASCGELYHSMKKRNGYTMVITDHQTPGKIQGLDLAQLISVEWPGLPVLILSGQDLSKGGILPSNVQCCHKPLQVIELLDIVRSMLKG